MVAKSTEEIEQLRGFSLAALESLGLVLSRESLGPIPAANSLRGLREAARDEVAKARVADGGRYRDWPIAPRIISTVPAGSSTSTMISS